MGWLTDGEAGERESRERAEAAASEWQSAYIALRAEVERLKAEVTLTRLHDEEARQAFAEVEELRAVLETREDMIDAAHAEVERLRAALEDEETLRNDTEMERDELRAALREALEHIPPTTTFKPHYEREMVVRGILERTLTTQEEKPAV